MAEQSTSTKQKASEGKKSSRLVRFAREAVLMMLIFIFFSTAVDIWRSQDMPKGDVPPLVMQTIQGETVDLIARSYEKPVLVYFWGTWCAVCRFVTPTINWLNDDFDVVSIAVTSGDDRRLLGYLNHHGYDIATINDNKAKLMKQWGVSAVPSVVIVKDGEVSSITTGFSTPPGLWLRMKLAS
ncbi:protein disulfide oxidoreductase [Photobacterium sanctipauli]|uniref:Protein disulfide oxidoreductase n=1 Tax=Photobacterium sanctipauli TaxID=1342794 RepID=A0A2T3P056_9GAMM|nr:protein disulfide oxidoreductase [Photobacterium sanctipauli]PSW21887.1 protein disulfide oxidoreductase [Photobacterium sanctipauli]